MQTKALKAAVLALAAFLFFAVGCTITTKPQTESRSVELGSARSVRTEIRMSTGKLDVAGGAGDLLDADFTYNVASWKPEVRYELDGTEGILTIEQPSGLRGVPLGKVRYEWNLRLNDDIPMDMLIELGAGNGNLELGNLSLTQLDIEMGAGNVVVNLSGSRSLTEVDVEMGAGDCKVDLTGNWKDDLETNIKGGVGEATLLLPRNVGMRVDAKGGIGKIKAEGLKKDGTVYVNDAYGKSKVTLHIDVKGAVGTINLELGK